MNIIRASEQDSQCIIDMISDCIKSLETQGIFQWDNNYPSSELFNSDINNGHGYIIKDNGLCIGYVALNEETSPEYSQITWGGDRLRALIVHRLAVHPLFQGRGIGKKIMNFIEAYAVNHKYSCIRLDAYSGNKTSLNLYEKTGYKKLGQISYSTRDLPFYCFEKVL